MAKKRRSADKQQMIPGTEPDSFPEIDRAAEAYREKRDERMELQNEEAKLRDELAEAMQERAITDYKYDGYEVVLETESVTKAKVKTVKVKKSVEELTA